MKRETIMASINYDYHAVRKDPGIKGMSAAANNPANRTVFQHYVEKHCSEKDRIYKKEMTTQEKQDTTITGGNDDLRLVSSLRTGGIFTNVTCLMTYLNAQLGEHEKLTAERIAELSKSPELVDDTPYAFFRLQTPQDMLNNRLSQAASFSFNPSPTRTDLLRSAFGAYQAELHISRNMANPEELSNGSYWHKLDELKNIAATTNYVGMSDTTIVMSIYDRYEEAFPGFLNVGAIWPSGQSDFTNAYMRITAQFQRELIETFGTAEKAQEAYRHAQYGNMNNFDIRSSIAAKYPPPGEMTMRDFSHMLREMMDVGADDGLFFAYARAMERTEMSGLAMSELMDTPFDINWLCAGFNELLNDGVQHERTRQLGTNKVLVQLFGVNLDNRGFASTNRRSPVDYASQARIISSKYDNWTERDYENWLLAEFSKGYEERLAAHEEWLERMKTTNVPIEIKPVKYNI